MRSYKLVPLTLIIIFSILINGCNTGESTPAPNVIATVNGDEITIEDIKKTIEATEVGLMMSLQFEGNTGNAALEKDFFARQIEQAQTEAQKRYYQRMEREYQSRYSKNENDIFNRVIREVVVSQEAKKQGYEVSIEEARESRKQMDEINRKALEQEGMTEDLKRLEELEEEAARRLGYEDREEWFEASLVGVANNMAKSRMEEEFVKFLMKTYPDVQREQWVALRSNAWEEYIEHLLRNSKVRIYNDDFKVVYYEEKWEHGDLDLKNQ